MDNIHRHAQRIGGDEHPQSGLGLEHQHRGWVHNAAIDEKGGQRAENSQGQRPAAEQPLAEEHSGNEAD